MEIKPAHPEFLEMVRKILESNQAILNMNAKLLPSLSEGMGKTVIHTEAAINSETK